MNITDILYTAVFAGSPEQELGITHADLQQADIVQISDDTVHLLAHHKSYLVRVIHADYAGKEFHLNVNGKDIKVKLRDEVESRVHAMGFDVSHNHIKLKHVSSPMPGMVLKILIREGDVVKEGQPVIVLEAMKMENVLNAPTHGIVSKVYAREKQNVDKNQLLLELE